MALRFSGRSVLSTGGITAPRCAVQVKLSCACKAPINLCAYENSLQVWQFEGPAEWSFGAVNDITFTLWNGAGTQVYEASYVAGDMFLIEENILRMSTSAALALSELPPAKYPFELWVVTASGYRLRLDGGTYEMKDTRKFDA